MSNARTEKVCLVWTPSGIQVLTSIVLNGELKTAVSRPVFDRVEVDARDFA